MKAFFIIIGFFLVQISQAQVSAYWSGVAGIFLTDGKTGLYFDPVFNKPSPKDLAFNGKFYIDSKITKKFLNKLPNQKIDAIFFSHTHFDHYADAPIIAKSHGSILHGSQTAKNLSISSGVPLNQIKVFQNKSVYNYGKFKIEVIESKHAELLGLLYYLPGNLDKKTNYPINMWDYKQGGSYSFIVHYENKKILIQQSVLKTPELKGKTVDVIFQTIASRSTTKYLDLNIWKSLKPKTIIPIHHDNFFFPIKDFNNIDFLYFVRMKEFRKYTKTTPYQIIEPKYFTEIKL